MLHTSTYEDTLGIWMVQHCWLHQTLVICALVSLCALCCAIQQKHLQLAKHTMVAHHNPALLECMQLCPNGHA